MENGMFVKPPLRPSMTSPTKSNLWRTTDFFHVMWAGKKNSAKKCVSIHMVSETCYSGQTGPVYQEDGFKIQTRPQYPNRVEGTEQLEATNSAINVVAKSMGPG